MFGDWYHYISSHTYMWQRAVKTMHRLIEGEVLDRESVRTPAKC